MEGIDSSVAVEYGDNGGSDFMVEEIIGRLQLVNRGQEVQECESSTG
jgi:uncharacterized protein YfkK (UPF0435 family)